MKAFSLRRAVHAALLSSGTAAFLSTPSVQAQTVNFDLPAQDAVTAIPEFARQAGLQIIAPVDSLKGVKTHRVMGALDAHAALRQLLEGTGLVVSSDDGRTISLRLPRVAAADTAVGSSADNEADRRPTDVLAEVIVTAQKRDERLIDVPISIVAVGSDELQKRRITTLEELAASVPDLSVARGGNFTAFEIRGISSLTGNGALVGIYLDESPVAGVTPINPVTYDLERVEVLRGPQGTLYGDGSAGGTVRLISKNPNLSKWGLDTEVTAMFTQDGDPSQRINAMANIPLIEDQLGLRIAATTEHDGGWLDQPDGGQKNINGQNLTNVRIKGLWQPDPQWTVSSMVIINRDDRGFDYSDVGSSHTYTQTFSQSTIPKVKNDYNLYNLTTAYDFSASARILNTISYLTVSGPMFNEPQVFPILAPGNPPYDVLVPVDRLTSNLLTDELRLSSTSSGPWQWTVGGFFRHAKSARNSASVYIGQETPPVTALPAPIAPFESNSALSKSWSAFGDASYRLSDRFTFGAGVRYFKDDQSLTDALADTYQSGTFHSTDPRVYAQFKLAPDINIYASAAKGFRSGGFNTVGQPTFGPESVWTYELGTKMALLDGQLDIDTSVFLSNYTNYVVFGADAKTVTNISSNAGDARIKGIEASATWSPRPQWRLEARGDYVNAKFTAIKLEQTEYLPGDRIDLVPLYHFTLAAQRDFSLLDKAGFARLDYSQQGPQTYRNRYVNGPGPGAETPWFHSESQVTRLLGLNTSLQLKDNVRVGLFVQNMLNDQHFTNPYWFIGEGIRMQPRTYGIQFSASTD